MALQRMNLVPPELRRNRCQTPPPPPFKKFLNCKDHSYNKWTQVRYLKTEKQKRELISIPTMQTRGINPRFKTKPKRVRLIGLKEKSYSMNPKTIFQSIFKMPWDVKYRTILCFVYTVGSFKIGRSNFKYNDKHLFVDGINYKWEKGS